jgi:hypothetical protein
VLRYHPNGVEGFSETLKKVRDAVHKIFPRELSPTRLAEKYGSDLKKKGAAKIAAATATSEAHASANDDALAAQLATIRAALPPPVSSFSVTSDPAPNEPAPHPAPNYKPWLIGGGILAVAAIVLGARK